MTYAEQYATALKYAASPGEHLAFVRRISENMTDPVPSLIYADYLDEQGDHGAAELIRRRGQSEAYGEADGAYHGHFPEGAPHVHLYPTMSYPTESGRPRPWVPGEESQPYRLHLIHRVEGADYHLGYGLTLTPDEAHHYVSRMPNVINADRARAELEKRYPRLRGESA